MEFEEEEEEKHEMAGKEVKLNNFMESTNEKSIPKDDESRADETARTNDQSNSFIESESKYSSFKSVDTADFEK